MLPSVHRPSKKIWRSGTKMSDLILVFLINKMVVYNVEVKFSCSVNLNLKKIRTTLLSTLSWGCFGLLESILD